MQTLQDLKLSGLGISNGGRYQHVRISGLGKVHGDIQGETIKTSGSASFYGQVETKELYTQGNAEITGRLDAQLAETSGLIKVEDHASIKHLINRGSAHFIQGLKAEKVISKGNLESESEVEAEHFQASGLVSINGLLNAHRIDIKFAATSYIREIGCDRIDVRMSMFPFTFLREMIRAQFMGERNTAANKLTAETIEGTHVYIEHTHAQVVRGESIVIGPKCEIELVEYEGTLDIHPSSTVRQQIKL
ncbi:hypothetical protein [Brevibacillus dissolubilis]|uniref:hypothetical protein n=1 Tax=Brevibacillus dissolubilis TaxID=1844116 RepID=UPI0011171DE7|nr:hypothetical protein [Brevibacillus dissolubilis]